MPGQKFGHQATLVMQLPSLPTNSAKATFYLGSASSSIHREVTPPLQPLWVRLCVAKVSDLTSASSDCGVDFASTSCDLAICTSLITCVGLQARRLVFDDATTTHPPPNTCTRPEKAMGLRLICPLPDTRVLTRGRRPQHKSSPKIPSSKLLSAIATSTSNSTQYHVREPSHPTTLIKNSPSLFLKREGDATCTTKI